MAQNNSNSNAVDQQNGFYHTVMIPTQINHHQADYSKGQDAMVLWVESLEKTINRMRIDHFQTAMASIVFEDRLYVPSFQSREDVIRRYPGLDDDRLTAMMRDFDIIVVCSQIY